jgi:hypothetical protein
MLMADFTPPAELGLSRLIKHGRPHLKVRS